MKAAAISAIVIAALVVVAIVALTVGVPVPFLAGIIAKNFQTATG